MINFLRSVFLYFNGVISVIVIGIAVIIIGIFDKKKNITGNFIKPFPVGSKVRLLIQPEDLEHDDQSNLQLEIVDRKFRGTSFIYTLITPSKKLIPVFVHSHHVHQHTVEDKFGIKRPIHIDHIVCF